MKVSIMDHAGSLQAVFHRDNGDFAFALDPDAAIELADMDPSYMHTMAAQLRSRRTSERLRAAAAARELEPQTKRSISPRKDDES